MVKSIYIHIPFCNNICTYCDFKKIYYNKIYINKYLDSLEYEIKTIYKNEIIDTIYIGGGTPSSLSLEELKRLFDIIKIIKLNNNYEFTFECNIENIDKEKLELLYDNKVNRLSIGIQTFNKKLLNILGRKHTVEEVYEKIDIIKKIGFKNISIDLIYAINGETLEDLKYDLECFLSLDIPHISCYSLILEPNTKLYIDKTQYIDEDLDYEMYKLINTKLKDYKHYEVSNYAKEGYSSKHNLVYWNNLEYYGFGLSASGYINNIRYTNTYNINKYINREYIKEKELLTFNDILSNEFILGLRKIDGINKIEFKNKYHIDINDIDVVNRLINECKLIDDGINIKIPNIYLSNNVLIEFLNIDYEKLLK